MEEPNRDDEAAAGDEDELELDLADPLKQREPLPGLDPVVPPPDE
jgi:hypothetical protein